MSEKPKVGILSTILLVGFAFVFDVVQIIAMLIPGVDVIADFFLGMVEIILYGLSFLIMQVPIDPLTASVVVVIEPIPFLGELPLLTPGVWNIIRIANKKHKEAMKKKRAMLTARESALRAQRERLLALQEETSLA